MKASIIRMIILPLAIVTCCLGVFATNSFARPQSIKIVMDDNYPPFVFKDGVGNLQGILIDQWRLWEKKTGIRAEISAMDWNEALRRMRDGEFDVLDTVFKTVERDTWLDFSEPYEKIEVPIFFEKDISGITDAASLKGFVVAVKAGDAAIEHLKQRGIDTLRLFNSYESIVQAAKERKINVFVVDKPPALYFLHKLGIKSNFNQSVPLAVGEFHRAVNRGDRKTLRIVEDGFSRISSGELKKIDETWYGSSLVTGSSLRYAGIAAGSLCLLLLALFIWNRILRTAVNKATSELKYSQELFSTAFQSGPLLMTISDVETGRYQEVNENFLRISGFSREETIGKTSIEIGWVRAEDRAVLVQEMRSQGRVTAMELNLTKKDGEQIWCLYFGELITIAGEQKLLSIAEDITDRKRAEDALLQSEQKFRAVFEQGFYFAGLLTLDGTLVDVNETALKFSGVEKQDVLGRWFWETTWWAHSPELQEKLRNAIKRAAAGEVVNFDATHPAADGSTHYVDFSLRPIKDQDGKVVLLVPEGRDVTGQRQAEEERLHLERQLLHAQKLESLGVLAGGVAHDFNNLLMAILGNLDLAQLRLAADSPAARNIFQAMNAARHAAELTNRMLAYSGRGTFVIEALDLNEVIEENAAMLKAAIDKTASLSLRLQRPLPQVVADVAQVQQVVMNLITNASDALDGQAGTITLTTGVRECDEMYLLFSRMNEKPAPGRFVWLEVADTGCGMDEETIHKIFDPFFTTKFVGRGLGLSAVLGIVRGHHGALMLDSTPGKGTTIRILFPAAVEGENIIVNEPEAQTEPLLATALSGLALVVDDEEPIRNICSTMVEHLGFRALTAVDGADAVRVFREHSAEISIVLLDMTMPRMDGFATFRELQRIKPDVRVILCSGFSEQEIAQRFAGEGLAGFIQKPYDMKVLTAALTRVMAGDVFQQAVD